MIQAGQQIDSCPAEEGDDIVDQSRGQAELAQQAAHHHQRHKVRHVGYGLDGLFVPVFPHFVDHQRQQDGRGEAEEQQQQVQRQGVADDAPGINAREELAEVLQPHPVAAQDALGRLVVFKGDGQAAHGHIVEQNVEDDDGQQHQIDIAVMPHAPEKAGLFRRSWLYAHIFVSFFFLYRELSTMVRPVE